MKVYLSKLKLDLTDQQKPVYPNQIKVLYNSNKGSQDFYQLLNYQCLHKNAPFLSWKKSLNLTIAENTWRHIFQICFKTVKDNDLIWLQPRVLYKILGTNDLLLKINKHGSGKCNFCDEQPETIVHLFVECKIVRQFWFILKAIIELVLQTNFNVNPSCIILGSLATNNLSIPLNTIYLTAKMYIFKTSRKNGNLLLDGFCNYLKSVYQEQEYVAKLDFRQDKFNKAWGNFYNLFFG